MAGDHVQMSGASSVVPHFDKLLEIDGYLNIYKQEIERRLVSIPVYFHSLYLISQMNSHPLQMTLAE